MRCIGRCARFFNVPSSNSKDLSKRGTRRPTLKTTRERSLLMSHVRQRGTQPELAVRAIARRLGHRLSSNVRGLPGSPDLCDRAQKKAVFVHGCFWHRHPHCSATTTPKTNRGYWVPKFRDNVARDARKISDLRELGYQTMTIWSCELRGTVWDKRLERKLKRFLDPSSNPK